MLNKRKRTRLQTEDDNKNSPNLPFGGTSQATLNAFGFRVTDDDLRIAFNLLDIDRTGKFEFGEYQRFCNKQLRLAFNERVLYETFGILDDDNSQQVTVIKWKNAFNSLNPKLQEFFRRILSAYHYDPSQCIIDEWPDGRGRVRLMRDLIPKKARLYARGKQSMKDFLPIWRSYVVQWIHPQWWEPLRNEQNFYAMTSGLIDRVIKLFAGASIFDQDLLMYHELCLTYCRLCETQSDVMVERSINKQLIQLMAEWIQKCRNDSTRMSWAKHVITAVVYYCPKPRPTQQIIAYLASMLNTNMSVWTDDCIAHFLYAINLALDTIHMEKKNEVHVQPEVLQACASAIASALDDRIADEAFSLLSRLELINVGEFTKILQKLSSGQRHQYKREYGPARIRRKNPYGNDSESTANFPKTPKMAHSQKVKQKFRMGQLAANTISKKMEKINSSSKKSGGVVDVKDFNKLHNPFDFRLSKLDFEMAFRYADINQDNAISFADFTQSLIKVGINISDGDAKKLFKLMSPKVRPVSMQTFATVMQAYPIELHSWLCRIMSMNHLVRQPFKHDAKLPKIKKLLKDQRKLTWKERNDALFAIARVFSRSNNQSKKQFVLTFKPFFSRMIDHCKDPNHLVVRSSCVAFTKIIIYKKGAMTKFSHVIMDTMMHNFVRDNSSNGVITESSYGLYANVITHVPDTKTFAFLKHMKKLVSFKNPKVRCQGWRLVIICLERILGAQKKRPQSWWKIMEAILIIGMKEKTQSVIDISASLIHVFHNQPKYYKYVENYVSHFPEPSSQAMKNALQSAKETIAERMEDYANEARNQAEAMEAYSLISDETDVKKADNSTDGGGRSNDEVRAEIQSANNLVLHSIDRDFVLECYQAFHVGSVIYTKNASILLSALKYLGIIVDRGLLVLLTSELSSAFDDENLTIDMFAMLATYCYSTTTGAWISYLTSNDMDDEFLDGNATAISNPKTQCEVVMRQLGEFCQTDDPAQYALRCQTLKRIYECFSSPEVSEGDSYEFHYLMNRFRVFLDNQLTHNLSPLWIIELCIVIARLSQKFRNWMERYETLYVSLFSIIARSPAKVAIHCATQAVGVLASQTEFLGVPAAKRMTSKLLECSAFIGDKNDILPAIYYRYQEIIYKCLYAMVVANAPLSEQSPKQKFSCFEMVWNLINGHIYNALNLEEREALGVQGICAATIAWLKFNACKSLVFNAPVRLSKDAKQMLELAMETKSWNDIFTHDTEDPVDVSIVEFGWINIQSVAEFDERMKLMEQWFELESRSNNPIGKAAVRRLMKALNSAKQRVGVTSGSSTGAGSIGSSVGGSSRPVTPQQLLQQNIGNGGYSPVPVHKQSLSSYGAGKKRSSANSGGYQTLASLSAQTLNERNNRLGSGMMDRFLNQDSDMDSV